MILRNKYKVWRMSTPKGGDASPADLTFEGAVLHRFSHRFSNFGGFWIDFDSIWVSFLIIFASLFGVVFLHRFRIDFLLIFGPSEPQKPYFYYNKSKVFARSPFHEKYVFFYFGVVFDIVFLSKYLLFRYRILDDFRMMFFPDFYLNLHKNGSQINFKMIPKWLPK